ncbi:hypothetical protein [Mucilaginibacter sp. L196]|uniref:hypothetical protein n=1 Tax=Mucilaginibacter sp. L196 TaxID=1641870 RepID=UPI00131DC035|nr:hypothetical protein [Mucilaginibacter sp. L196]
MGKTYYKVVIRFFIIAVAFMAIMGIYFTKKEKKESLSYEFNGKVDSVSYDVKGEATVYIDTSYYLGDPNWDFDHNRIQKGDSMIKEKNSMIIKLIKPNGKVIIEGEN